MKTHVRKGTGNGCDEIPLCGFSNRRGWRVLPDQVVGAKDFNRVPEKDRCKLCEMEALNIRNR